MRSVRDIPVFHNIPILVRTALNVPLESGRVAGEYRLRRALPTVRFLAERGARVILISHIGEQGTETLAPVAEALKRLTTGVAFCGDTIGVRARDAIRTLQPGQILVLENLRRNRGEVANDKTFAKELAALADVFVQDSFDTCHRAHASIIGVPELLPSYAGFLLEEEVEALSQALTPARPSLAVIGGAKFTTKEGVLTRLLNSYDHVFVGGALANDFLKASGFPVGKSLVSGGSGEGIEKVLANKRLVIPADSRVLRGTQTQVVRNTEVEESDVIIDHGPDTSTALAALAGKAKTILWNGPLGKYEDGFTDATDAFAKAVASSKAHSVVGGGDTITSIERLNLLPQFSFVSTGGGAMLEFLSRGTLPGLEALDNIT